MTEKGSHQPVLLQEAVAHLVTDRAGFYIDGTFGRGGHSRALLEQLEPTARLLVLDKDPRAIVTAQALAAQDQRVVVEHASFTEMGELARKLGWYGKVAGVLLDLGVSSPQLDDPERGFSFMHDGPLDMRMNDRQGETAADWLNRASAAEIGQVLRDYGEERFHARIARAIVAQRTQIPLQSTQDLVKLIERAVPVRERHKHPATRSFQAIRIALNGELDELKRTLAAALELLQQGGRLTVISFHSLEDRIVKQFIRREEKGPELPRGLPVKEADMQRRMRSLTKAIRPAQLEVNANPRARSATLRVAEKLA